MLKSDLIEILSQRFPHLSPRTVESAVKLILDHMAESIASGKRVEIRRFGSFFRQERKARTGRNPKTGKPVQVSATGVARFRPGLPLKKIAVDSDSGLS
jgi:integration host factor subunit beta